MMRMMPPRAVQCKTCILYLAVSKTEGNPQKGFKQERIHDLYLRSYHWHGSRREAKGSYM